MIRVLLVMLALAIAGCTSSHTAAPGRSVTDPAVTETVTDFEPNIAAFAAVRGAGRVVLYEGLPHPMDEPKVLAAELARGPTRSLHGYPFYREPLELKAEDAAKLREILADRASFHAWGGEKKCGGFHPDYCVEFDVDGTTVRYLICFGCYEAKIFGPDNALRCDMRMRNHPEFKALLSGYRKNRPAMKVD